uniref:Protein Njmu-R1 n=1 Tax=Callorhinchus milii TaxID=7868 RepID=V9KN75_CALMI
MISQSSLQESVDGDDKETDPEADEAAEEPREQRPTETFYCVYRRLSSRSQLPGDDAEMGYRRSSSSDTFSKEMSAADFSLSLVVTNLPTVAEPELRGFIIKRLSKGAFFDGMGTIATVELSVTEQPVACYYCLLHQNTIQEPDSSSSEASGSVTDHVLCFLGSTEKALELFRIELDKYAQGLELYLEAEADILEAHLKSWYDESVLYLQRVVQLFQEKLSVLLRAALSHTLVEVKHADNRTKQDVERFLSVASLQGLIQEDRVSTLSEARSQEQQVISVDCGEATLVCHNAAVSNRFCEDWIPAFSNALKSGNPFLMRQILENFKLKAIQDMNSLKRSIRQAETSNYALYKCYTFLKNCGNGDILLHTVRVEHAELPEARNVVQVLEEFMHEEGVITSTD